MSILEHCAAPARLLGTLRRLLAPQGVLLLSAPLAYIGGHCPPDHWRFARQGLALLAKDAGFSAVTTGSLGDLGPWFGEILGSGPSPGAGRNGVPLITWLIASRAAEDVSGQKP